MTAIVSTYEELQLRSITPLPVPNDTQLLVPGIPYPSGVGQRTVPLPLSIPKGLVVKHSNAIRLLIADDHQMVREGLVALLGRRPDIEVVGQASNGRELVEQFLLHRPDVALVDLRMPELGGAEAIAEIREQIPEARAIVLTTYDDDDDIKRSFEAGAKAYMLKDTGREELLACIKAVHDGGTLIPHGIPPKPR